MLLTSRLSGRFQRANLPGYTRFSSQNVVLKPAQDAQTEIEPPVAQKRRKTHWRPNSDIVQMTTRLCWLLRHGAHAVGLNIRPDGYLPLRDVLLTQGLRFYNLEMIQHAIAVDPGKRFQLKQMPGNMPGSTVWWIRASGKHTMKTVNPVWKEVKNSDQVSALIYQANSSDWKTIRENGIWPDREDDLIHFVQSVPEDVGVKANGSSSMVLVYIDVKKVLRAGLSMYVTHTKEVVSEGDYRRCIVPQFFEKAVYVRWTKEVLWGSDE